MVSNQTNRLQSLDSSVEEFVDGDENENAKTKDQPRCCSVPRISCFERRDETNNGQIDSSKDEQGIRTRNTSPISNFELPKNYFDIFSGCLISF